MNNNPLFQNLLKMSGVSNELFNQLTLVKSMLDKLPLDERQRVMTNFVKDLEEAVKKVEGKSDVDVKEQEDN